MTSIAVAYNKLGVAIAADSAATAFIGGDSNIKIFDANKIFKISDTVGIGIYQNPNLGNIPLEITINEYKKNLHAFSKLEEYVYSFIEYLEKTSFIENKNIEQELYLFIVQIGKELNDYIKEETIKEKTPITDEMVKNYAEKFFKRSIFIEKPDGVTVYTINHVEKKSIGKIIPTEIEVNKNILKTLLVNNNEHILLEHIDSLFVGFENYINKSNLGGDFTGFIFVGFGQDEILPKIFHLKVRGKYNGKIYFEFLEEDNKKNTIECGIFGYADAEVITSTVCGYSPKFGNMINNLVIGLFGEIGKKIKKEHKLDISEDITKYKNKIILEIEKFRLNEVNSFIGAINFLSLNELSDVVETLINVTSFKKRISTKLETVGGETDVAVISKFDGFKWIKRKNYYKHELNID